TATREDGDVTFLHRVVPGASSSSYGVEVAELAGVPGPVVDRARDLVAAEEAERGASHGDGPPADGEATAEGDTDDGDRDGDASLREFLAEEASEARGESGPGAGGPSAETPTGGDRARPTDEADGEAAPGAPPDLAAALRDLDLARMTPIEALNALHDLQSRVDDDG
ncbi:DNA mismatch repair protein MutS, partial [Halorubrum sp. SS5]